MTDQPSKSGLYPLLLLAVLFAAFMCAGVVIEPPPLRASNTAAQFDARAAQARLSRILGPQVAHPIDSATQDGVRARLLQEITALGFKPEVHEAFACRPQPRGPLIDCGHVRNIVFSIGDQSGPAILATSHYDSVPAGPGASDDGIGYSVWLQVAKQLAHQPLKRRIIFLISDGEEQALLGAYHFGQHDPLMQSVTTLVDLEARGTRGPAVFFESNEGNADAVNGYAAAPRPLANSVMADIYHFLPNSTDVSALTRPGLDVINIAVLDGVENYHTPHDTITAQDIRSVQHMGDQALAIMQHLAAAPDQNAKGDLVYTDIASRLFISLPSWLSLALLVAGLIAAIAAWWRASGDGRFGALAAPLAGLVMAAGFAFLAGLAFSLLEPGVDFWWAYRAATRAWCIAFGLLGIVAAAAIFGRKASAAQLGAAGFAIFALLGAAISLLAPGISILFALPIAPYAIGVALSFAWRPAQAIGALAAAFVALIIWAPMLHLTELALGFDLPFVSALLFAVAVLPWLGLLTQLKHDASWRFSWQGASAAALVAVIATALLPASTAAMPHYVNLLHFTNNATGAQRVLAGAQSRALPPALAHAYPFAPELIFPGDTRPYWSAPAPADAQPNSGPTLRQLAIETHAAFAAAGGGQMHILHARIDMNGAYRLVLRIPKAAKPRFLSMAGATTDFADVGEGTEPTDFVNVGCDGRSCDGMELAITLDGDPHAGDWYIVGYYPANIDPVVAAALPHRTNTATPIQFGDGGLTLSKLALTEDGASEDTAAPENE
ncbi:MAG: M28 family peptidase [Terricaulis sp.]